MKALLLLLLLTTPAWGGAEVHYYAPTDHDCKNMRTMLQSTSKIIHESHLEFTQVSVVMLQPNMLKDVPYRAMAPFLLAAAAGWQSDPDGNHDEIIGQFYNSCTGRVGKPSWMYYE